MQTKNGGVIPTGALMMLKAMGLDPEMLSQGIENARNMAQQTVEHFDKRLQAIETEQRFLREAIVQSNELMRELCQTLQQK